MKTKIILLLALALAGLSGLGQVKTDKEWIKNPATNLYSLEQDKKAGQELINAKQIKLNGKVDLTRTGKDLNSPDEQTRLNAVNILSYFPSNTYVNQIEEMLLNDPSNEVKYNCAKALHCLNSTNSIPVLIQALKTEDYKLKLEVALALAFLGEKTECFKTLEYLGKSGDRNIILDTHLGYLDLATNEATEKLKTDLSDTNSYVSVDAAIIFAELGYFKEAYPVLKSKLADGDKYIRMAALRGLAYIGTDNAIKLIKSKLDDTEILVSERASLILKNCNISFTPKSNLKDIKSYSPAAAASYADTWWNAPNPAYSQTYYNSGNDCAYFVSQCLINGGLSLSGGGYADGYGCISSCDNLNSNLINYQGCTHSHLTSSYPSWFVQGDVAIFGTWTNDGDGDPTSPYEHATINVVSGTPALDAHTNNRHHEPVSFYYPSSSGGFTTGDFYHFSTATCALTGITPTLISPGTSSSPGTTITTTTPTLSWNAVAGATNYGVYIRDMSSNTLVLDNNCATSGTSYTVPSGILSSGGSYRWNMQANVSCGNCVSNNASPYYFQITNPCTGITAVTTQPQSQTVCSGTSATFTVAGNGTPPLSYFWINGSGSVVGNNSTLVTSTAGSYHCNITNCSSAYGQTSNTATLTVTPIPPAPTSIDNTTPNVCSSSTATVDLGGLGQNPSYSPYNGQWVWYTGSCGGTQVGTGTDYYVNISQAGTYTYYLRAENSCGHSTCASTTVTVTLSVNASVNITANPSVPICAGTAVTFTATVQNGGTLPSYQWKKNGNDISGATNSTYTSTTLANGDIITCVLSSNATCVIDSPVSSNAITMTVNSLPTVSISASGNPICTGASTTLTASGASTYSWSNGLGTANPVTVTPASTTTYTVTGTTAGCNGTASNTVMVNATPASPSVTATVTYCQNATASQLTATGSNLLWYSTATGGTGSSTAPTPTTTSAGTVSYYVSQTVNTCESSRSQINVITNATPAAPSVTATVTYCQNATALQLTATGNNLLWYTIPAGGTGSSIAPTPSTASIGTTSYYVTQTINNCESPRATINVVVHSLPQTPVISQVGNDLSSNASSGNQWFYNNVIITGAISQTYTPTDTGNYYSIVTDINGCISDTSNVLYIAVTGLSDLSDNNNIHIYPNPANDNITIENTSLNNKDEMISIYNIQGQLLIQQPMLRTKINIDISGFAGGMYYVKVKTEEGMVVKKLVKE